MPARVTVADLRTRARSLFERKARRWAVGDDASAVIDVPLHPPTEREVLADYHGALAWVESWRGAESSTVGVTWEPRRWGSVGTQTVPTRARVAGAAAVASAARMTDVWRLWQSRAEVLLAALDDVGVDGAVGAGAERAGAGHAHAHGPDGPVAKAVVTHLRGIGELDTTDFQRLVEVCRWLRRNPDSGRYVRELPIRGIDSKWIERRAGMVTALVTGSLAARGIPATSGLGMQQPPALVRIRLLDPELALEGFTDITAPLEEVSRLHLRPRTVIIVENLQTFLALPSLPGTVAIDGHGYIVPRLVGIDWLRADSACEQEVPVRRLYWGDLDSHGLSILSKARAAGLELESCLMDTETLLAFRDLWIPDRNPYPGMPTHLTSEELATFARLREEGNVGLEQERISWDYALDRLRR